MWHGRRGGRGRGRSHKRPCLYSRKGRRTRRHADSQGVPPRTERFPNISLRGSAYHLHHDHQSDDSRGGQQVWSRPGWLHNGQVITTRGVVTCHGDKGGSSLQEEQEVQSRPITGHVIQTIMTSPLVHAGDETGRQQLKTKWAEPGSVNMCVCACVCVVV